VKVRASDKPYLLTGFLVTPDGAPWAGEWDKMDAGLYRVGKGRRISCRRVDQAVLEQLRADLMGDDAVDEILTAMRAIVAKPSTARRSRRRRSAWRS
jgi:hypothetical protein